MSKRLTAEQKAKLKEQRKAKKAEKKQKGENIFTEFKAFVSKGNVFDMAVGVIIGGAFGKIISSLVGDILMPLIGLLTGGVSLNNLKYVVKEAVMDGETVVTPEVAVLYGQFIQFIIDFLLVALCIFIVLKIINSTKERMEEEKAIREAKEEEAPAPATTKVCPFCQSEINIKATRCPHYTSELKD